MTLLSLACGGNAEPASAPPMEVGRPATNPEPRSVPENLRLEVLRELPHNQGSYTQGLLIYQGLVYESRGQFGRSGLDVWDPESGEIVRAIDLDGERFGEGLVRVEDSLWQLTWHSGKALRWRLPDLTLESEADYPGEGWGLAYDGQRLIMSDGTHQLRFFDPEHFAELGTLSVRRGARPQDLLNELEFVVDPSTGQGVLWANLYQTNEIVRIDLESGLVTAIVTAEGLLTAAEQRRADVLNGIAHWPERDSFLITGKHWPKSFEVRFRSTP